MDTIRTYIENRLFGLCWAFQSFRERCYQHQNRTTGAEDRQKYRFGSLATNTRTGRPEPPTQQHSPEQHQSASYWSCRALESHVLALMGAVRQYQSHTAGTCQNLTLRRLYNLSTLPEMEQLKNHEYGKCCEQKRTFGNSRKTTNVQKCSEHKKIQVWNFSRLRMKRAEMASVRKSYCERKCSKY